MVEPTRKDVNSPNWISFPKNPGWKYKKCLSCHHQEELIMAGYERSIESPYLSLTICHLGVTQHCTILECLSSKTITQITWIHEGWCCKTPLTWRRPSGYLVVHKLPNKNCWYNKNSITREHKMKLKLNAKFKWLYTITIHIYPCLPCSVQKKIPITTNHNINTTPTLECFSRNAKTGRLVKERCIHPWWSPR